MGFEALQVREPIRPNDYVELERWGCYGSCPVYTVRLYADGTVLWNGRKFVAVLGDQSGQVNPSDAAALIQSFRERGFWTLCSSYSQPISDGPTWLTTVHIGNHVKRVANYAETAPAWLTALDHQIDSLTDSHPWRVGDPSKEKMESLNVFRDFFDPKPGLTPLMIAAGGDDLAEVRRLCASGADANARDSSGWTALVYAAQLAHKPVMDALLDAGADVSVRSFTGQTAIMAAIPTAFEVDQKIQSLIAYTDINEQDQDGQTALMIAANRYPFTEGLRSLLKFGPRKDLRDTRRKTALDYLLRAKHVSENHPDAFRDDEAVALLR